MLSPNIARRLGWTSVFLLFAFGIFNLPIYPSVDLDPSWRMALGYFSQQGSQFGTDVVFTYGPLGFVTGKTYSGIQFWSLIAGQALLAVVSAAVLTAQARRLQGYSLLFGLGFFSLFGIIYEDALHMLVIVLLGFFALRQVDRLRWPILAVLSVVLAGFSLVKFTDFVLAAGMVCTVAGYAAYRRQWRACVILIATYAVMLSVIWLGLGQNLGHLPAYVANSWEVSQGYQWAMGFPTPNLQLGLGLFVLVVLIAYAGFHLVFHADKPRAVANLTLIGVFTYMNWKHGFIRPDGHMIGFFICAMLPLTNYPVLLDDTPRFSRLHRWAFLVAILASLWAMESSIWGVVRGSLGTFQGRIWNNVAAIVDWDGTQLQYRDRLQVARQTTNLPRVRELAGQATIDVLGSEQGIALLNRFNYKQRPVFQGYSVFTPALSKLNAKFYAAPTAPYYVLMKIQSIDTRLPTMDDPEVLQMLMHRYIFQFQEGGFLLWKRKSGEFDAAKFTPRRLRTQILALDQPMQLTPAESDLPLWLKVDLQPSWLGRLRAFLYKPPQVKLRINLANGDVVEYLMPLPQGRTGFIINPLVEDHIDYLQFASNQLIKRVTSIALVLNEGDAKFFSPSTRYELSALPPGEATPSYLPKDLAKTFYMFKNCPVTYEAALPVSVSQLSDKPVAMLHAPSQMVFELPPRSKNLSGQFGMLTGSYTGDGHTNGAEFLIYWSDGSRRVDLFRRFLNPGSLDTDRGLQDFSIAVDRFYGGRIYFETKPGPYGDNGWDWTTWTNVYFSR